MTDETWVRGFHDLVLAFPDRDVSMGYASERGALYRKHLDDLSDEQWLYGVAEAVRSERWFPTIAVLRDYAEAWRPTVAGFLPARTDEEKELDRAAAKRGLEMIKEALAKMQEQV